MNSQIANNKMPQSLCRSCFGKGSRQVIGERDCRVCHDTCRDFNSDLWSEPCRICGGRGREVYTEWVRCETCYGTGFISY